MGHATSGDDRRTGELEARLEEVERRLLFVENHLGLEPFPDEAPAEDTLLGEVDPDRITVPLLGRTLVVLAGAFALRALTEQGVVPQAVGTILGILYAGIWIMLSERAGRRGQRTSATFHGVAAAAIGYPLVWEATTRFGILSAVGATGVLTVLTGVALAVAWRRGLRRLAWVIVLGAGTVALALVTTRAPMPYASFLLAVGMGTLWLGYVNGWRGPGWLAAVFVDAAILFLTVVLLAGRGDEIAEIFDPASLVALQLAMMILYLVSFGARTLTRDRPLQAGEIAQGVAALVFGLGLGAVVTVQAGLSLAVLGGVSLVLAVGCYGVAFAVMEGRENARVNFGFYTTLALVLTVAGVVSLAQGPSRSITLAVVAVLAAWLGDRRGRVTLSLHAAAYTVAAAVTSGLSVGVLAAFAGPESAVLGWISLPAVIALAAAAVCSWFRVEQDRTMWGPLAAAPKALLLATVALGVDALLVTAFVRVLGGAGDPTMSAGALDAARTAVLALTAVALATMSRWPRVAEAAWRVYPGLALGAGKLLFEDLRHGEASTLFVSLAFYGAALIVAPRILARSAEKRAT